MLFDLVMASRGTCPRATRIIYLGKLSLTYAGYGWETRAPVSPACFLPLGVHLPLSQKHAVRRNHRTGKQPDGDVSRRSPGANSETHYTFVGEISHAESLGET